MPQTLKEKGRLMRSEIVYQNTVPAIFVRRLNRFTAVVLLNGTSEIVHIRNTGRLENLLVPKAKVTLQKSGNPNRKTAFDLISVYRPKFKWINIDSLAPNVLMRQHLEQLGVYECVQPEYTYGESRIDFHMTAQGEHYLTEVKGCTLADDIRSGIGFFPDAPTERGIKHLKELTKAAREGWHCSIDFVIQMNGIHMVFPNDQVQPEFRRNLEQAAMAGVRVIYHSCHVEADRIWIIGVADDTGRYIKKSI